MKNVLSLFLLSFILFVPATLSAWECDITLDAPKTIKLDQAITLTAEGTPPGGSYSWSRIPHLTHNGDTATLIGHKPTYSEYIQVMAYYKTPKGKKCSDMAWLWPCLCKLDSINGKSNAKIEEEVSLSTIGDPPDGTYTWAINSGSGSITADSSPDDSSAVFVGDQAGTVEIKASYVPPEGGEPCVKYHTIEVEEDEEDECEVTLTASVTSRPICRSVEFHAQGTPPGGNYSWEASHGVNGSGSDATYDSSTVGTDTVTVTYIPPNGASCNASKPITSFSLSDDFFPKKNCFYSGDALLLSDFTLNTEPSGYHDEARLSPTIASTLAQQEKIEVTASLLCQPGSNQTFTYIDVVNKNVTLSSGIEIKIPNQLTKPLEIFGLADKLEFSIEATSEKTVECCDTGPGDNITGRISINAKANLTNFPIAFSVPITKKMKEYFSLGLLVADLNFESSLKIEGEYQACQTKESWDSAGKIAAEFGLGSHARVDARYILIQGEVKGKSNINQTINVDSSKITSTGSWSGITINGLVKITIQSNDWQIKAFDFSHQVLQGDATKPLTIALPSLH